MVPSEWSFLLCFCRVKSRHSSWGMKAIWGLLEPSLREQRKTVSQDAFIYGVSSWQKVARESILYHTLGFVRIFFLMGSSFFCLIHLCFSLALDPNQYSWGENYAGSSGLMSTSPDLNPMQRARSGTVSLLEKKTLKYWKVCLRPPGCAHNPRVI